MLGVYFRHHAPGGIASVVTIYDENIESLRYLVTVGSRDANKFKKSYYFIVSLIKFLSLMLFDKRIKIVHIQGSHGVSYNRKKLFVYVAKFFNKKVIWHMHASQFVPFYNNNKDKKEIVKMLNMSDTLIVLSQYYYDFYKTIGVDEKKIVILNNIVSHPNLNKMEHKDGRIHFLFLGEISDRKGIFDLLQVIVDNREYFSRTIAIKLGGNGEVDRVNSFIKSYKLENIVTFEGWVCSQKKIDLLNWADVYILPSYNEGLPISILEALSYACPVISTPVGGIKEVVHKGLNGVIVEPGNLQQIRDALKYYVEHPDRIENEGRESCRIVEPFYPEPVISCLKKIYMKYLGV